VPGLLLLLAFAVITFCVRVYTRSGFNPHLMRAPSLIEALVLHTEPYFIVFGVRAKQSFIAFLLCEQGQRWRISSLCFCDAMGLVGVCVCGELMASGKNELYQRKAVHC
jgi:hypothetical protein